VRLSVVIPAYNEAGRLPTTLATYLPLLPADAEVLVVDDGSSDATSVVVRAIAAGDARLRLICLPTNRGKGYAVRTGVLSASGDRVLFADADGATPIEELARLIAALDAGADVAIGSREHTPAGLAVHTTAWRRFAGRVFHQIVRYAGVKGITDSQCGFKLFRGPAAAALFSRLRVNGFAFDVELLLLAQRFEMTVAEVPVNWTHQPGSKVRVVRDGLHMAMDVLRLRAMMAARVPAPRGAPANGRVDAAGEQPGASS
jgi:dolichyl-phosphate beta-glucosyltransferase